MRALLLPALLVLGCGPKEDYTPQIVVQPDAASRICFFCSRTLHETSDACPAEVAESCSRLFSDLVDSRARLE